jgi:hypothetical protein
MKHFMALKTLFKIVFKLGMVGTPVISVLRRLKKENFEFKARMGCIEDAASKKRKKKLLSKKDCPYLPPETIQTILLNNLSTYSGC